MDPLSLMIIAVAALGSVAVIAFLRKRPEAEATAPPPRAWKSETVTPVIQGARNKAPERVSRSFVVGQGALLALRMAEIDGEIHATERQAIKDFIMDRVTGADELTAQRALQDAEAGLENAIALERAIEGVRAVSSEEQRELLLDLLVHVAIADGAIHENEVGFLKRIGGLLGLSDESIEQRVEGAGKG